MQECFKDLGYSKAEFPHAEQASVNTLAIPIYPELTPAQRACVVEQIKEFYTAR
jgi:dTDP-4-amino-4,6-dideoxygalactose transaminase